jgi:hypothetical protein
MYYDSENYVSEVQEGFANRFINSVSKIAEEIIS